ncbi:MAG: DNA-binding response regulator [Clostridiales bacterium]|uniref:Stage 0 sporulation protein A homolog n=1 Tax=Harryflintia acetispora TaxID=1849041 RepID=A0A9X8Y7B4_9FIRM|nr:response regulator transcription factor [Harryflintia acetispora]PWM37013.1 MAG: DNA-binding response regulator [Clostridiales bacterium]RGB64920.1 DNA-binding response regulator [Harryflintia acetispora]TCL41863.1 DNA-binding response OmpR family regulator [Harryflintia acetispora]
MANILVVEDEVLISELIRRNLSLVGHGCDPAFDGDEALEKLSGGRYDLMILDVMLPKRDGFAVMGEAEGLPTIFLTARDGLNERITGFSLGADDYIVKPFEMLELLARVEAVLRRTQKHAGTFELDQARVDFGSRQVYRGDALLELTPKEYELLTVLISNRNIALSRERLLELVWGYDFEGESRTVDVHIQKLRRKLGWEERIKTVYKLGYRLEAHG